MDDKRKTKSEKAPNHESAGVIVQAEDGRMFFLSDEEAARTKVTHNAGLCRAYLLTQHHRHAKPVLKPYDECSAAKYWLDHHPPGGRKGTEDPDGSVWRQKCEWYFEDCYGLEWFNML
jgi:hypothetical protein